MELVYSSNEQSKYKVKTTDSFAIASKEKFWSEYNKRSVILLQWKVKDTYKTCPMKMSLKDFWRSR